MGKSNGQADIRVEDKGRRADLEHELPAADPADGFEEKEASAEASALEPRQDDEIKKLREERDSLFDRLARLQAEFDNYRKRAARENADFRDYALADAAKALLPVVDNFDLALKAPAKGDDADLRKGIELIRRQLDDTLAKLGVKPMNVVGGLFDPRYHEAVEMVETSDVKDNHVVIELQRGYFFKDRLLRPAMVRVARN